MRLIEIRDLDGPNIFLLEPAIKVEFETAEGQAERAAVDRVRRAVAATAGSEGLEEIGAEIGPALCGAVRRLHVSAGVAPPVVTWANLELPGHVAIAFGWTRRRFARALAEQLVACATGQGSTFDRPALQRLLALPDDDDRPLLVRDNERTVRAIAVTGTNGKTTTTRVIAHVLRTAGYRVGWCSSSGVYIEGQEVLSGDYSGPSGARRVLLEPGLDVGVLETARGGILLRGLAYESNDVSVFTNVSADHLHLQGVETVEGMAQVKATVIRVTRSEGYAVLNADDALVMAAGLGIRAQPFLITQKADNPAVAAHARAGGRALIVDGGDVIYLHAGERERLLPMAEIPMTFGGRARHMVENALCAAAACLAFGLSPDQTRHGLVTFRNAPDQNAGRLNLFRVGAVTVILDFAHNEAGLAALLSFARNLRRGRGKLTTIVGTAGDRSDESLRAIGRIAAEASDRVIAKETEKYLRGRTNEEMIRLYFEGVERAGGTNFRAAPNELSALAMALDEAQPGDVIAIMAHEQIPELLKHLSTVGVPADDFVKDEVNRA